MSTTIDQRVVEMRFDNKQFEQNVNTSMSTLDKLKQKLNLSGASKGLENINAAAKNNNLSALGTAASTVASKFSAMEVMGVTALANITNQAVNAGKRMVAALTIDPVKTGFNEYELKMDSVKTIMASTGESVQTVNKYLNELNEYSDQTIYSFSDMTQNIGKFTNAGVKLEDAVMAIKGISNEAAVSGANANEASRAMYNFAQALSAGYVKLIDWKSIENANMATVEFKQQLIDTAVELGTVTKAADGMYQTLDGNAFNATKNFNEVFQDQWMTSEVLVKTLKNYADETTDIGQKAKKAATEVTKLSQVFDIAKETAQSGWARTWEILFGDIESAKALFTPISEFINGILDGMSDFRNTILESAFASPFKGLAETIEKVSTATETASAVTKDFANIIDDVLGGKLGNGQKRWDALTEAGYNWAEVQNKINEMMGDSTRHAVDTAEAQEGLNASQETRIRQLLKLSDAELKALGLTAKEVESLRELEKQSKNTGIPIEDLVKDLDQLSGRNLFITSLKNIGESLGSFFKSIGYAWRNIFPPKSAEERGKEIYEVIAKLHKITSDLNDVMSDRSSTNTTFYKLVRTFKGLFAAIDIVATVVAGPFRLAFKIVQSILKAFDLDILDLTANIGDAIVNFRKWFKEHDLITRGIKALIPFIEKAISAVGKWIDALKNTGFVSGFIEDIRGMINGIREWIDGMKEAENIPLYIIQGLVNGLKNGVKLVIDGVIGLGKAIIESFCKLLGIESPSVVFFAIGGFIVAGLLLGLKDSFPEVFDVLKGFGEKCIDVLGNIDWGSIFAAGSIAGFLFVAGRFATALKNISEAFKGAGELFERTGKGVEKALKGFGKMMSGLGFKFIAEGVKDMAIAVAILVASIIALSFFDAKDLWKSVAVIAAVAAILGVLAWAMTKISDNSVSISKEGVKLGNGLGGALLALAAAILMITFVVKMLGKMDEDQAKQGIAGLAAIVVMIMGVFSLYGLVVKGKSAQNIDKFGKMLTKMAISLLLLVAVVKLTAGMDPEAFIPAGILMGGLLTFIALLATISMIPGKQIGNISKNLLKIAGSLVLLAMFVKLTSGMDPKTFIPAGILMAGFLAFIAIFMAISMIPGKQLDVIGGTLFKVSAALLLLVIVVKMLAGMEWNKEKILSAAIGIGGLLLVMTAMVLITRLVGPSDLSKLGTTLILMAVAIGILAGVVALLGFMDIGHLGKGLLVVSTLAAMMAVMIHATKNAQKCVGNIVTMTIAIALMATAVALLSFIDPTKLVVSTLALLSLMGMFAVVMKTISNLDIKIGPLITMTVALAIMAGAIYLVGQLDSVSALASAAGLSVLLLALAGSMIILDQVRNVTTSALVGAGVMTLCVAALGLVITQLAKLPILGVLASAAGLSVLLLALAGSMIILDQVKGIAVTTIVAVAVMGVVVALLAGILGIMSAMNVEGSIQTAISIGLLLTAMSAALVIASYAGPNALMSVVSLALIAVVVGLLGVVLGLMAHFNVEPSIEVAAALSLLLISMSAALVLLSAVGLLGPAALIGIASLAALIVGIGGLIVGIGALFDKFPMLEEFLNRGIPILQKIGEGLGKFFGGIVGGFMEGVADSLPHLGQCLSDFMTNAQPFIDGVKSVDSSALEGIGILALAIIALTAADVINGIASFLSGGDSFAHLGTELSAFMSNAQVFMAGIGSIDASTVEAVKSLAQAILIITAADLINGITSFIMGESSLSNFAAQLPLLGKGIAGLVNTLGDTDISKVTPAANAVKALASAAQQIPNAGGLLASLVGDNELSTFASQFPKVGTGIRRLVENLGGIDIGQVGPAAEAVKTLAKAAQEIPNAGGLLASLVGDNDLGTFASQFPKVGKGIAKLVENLAGVDVGAVAPAANAVKTLANVAKEIPNTGGLLAGLVGDNDLGTFASEFPKVGKGIAKLVENLGTTDLGKVSAACDCVKEFIDAASVIPNSGGVVSWFTGDNDLADFGKSMADLGEYMYDFYSEVCLADTTKFSTYAGVLQQIIDVVKTTNGLSTSGVDTLKTAFDKFAEMKIAEFKEKFSESITAPVNRVIQLAEDLASVKEYTDNTGIEKLRSALITINAFDIAKFKEQFGEGLTTYVSRVKSLATGISELSGIAIDAACTRNLRTAVSTLADASVPELIETFSGSVNDAISDMRSLVKGINDLADLDTDKTASFKEAVTNLANTGVSGLIKTFDGSSGKLKTTGAKIVESIVSGLKSKESSIGKSLTGGLSQAVSAANGYQGSFYSAGSYLATGFANGISANAYKAAAQARAMAKAAAQAAEEALGIASPSKVFRAIGNFAGLGFVNELHNYADKSYDAGSEMADSARDGLKDSINKVLGIMNGSMDVNPTIRPVLDLSGVESGVGILNGMFGNDSTIGVSSNLRAINATFGQNGGNDDVIRAINKLGTKLDSVGGTTNVFEGITYGSADEEINNAVSTLVRAARVERRR